MTVPDKQECQRLLQELALPAGLQRHLLEVSRVADRLAEGLNQAGVSVDPGVVHAASALHDVGKSTIVKQRMLDEGMSLGSDPRHELISAWYLDYLGFKALVSPVRKHVVTSVLDPEQCPDTWEEKIVYYADKRVTQELVPLDQRFKDWSRRYPDIWPKIKLCWPYVKDMEQELFANLPAAVRHDLS